MVKNSNGITGTLTDLVKTMVLKNLNVKQIQNELEKKGIIKDYHYVNALVFRIKKRELKNQVQTQPATIQTAQTQPTTLKTTVTQQQPITNASYILSSEDLKKLIPSDNGFIDSDSLIEDLIKAYEYNLNASDSEEKLNIKLYGETGTGKTEAGVYLAHKLKLPLWNYTFNGETTTEQLLGYKDLITDTDGNLKTIWRDGILTKAVRNGGVLLLNELNACTSQIAFCLFSLLEKSRILILTDNNNEIIKANKNLFIIATLNLNYEGTNALNTALDSRLNTPREIKYNEDVEKKLIKKGKILNKNLLDLAKKQRLAYYNREYTIPISTRELIIFSIHYKVYGLEKSTEFLLNKFTTEEEKKSIKDLIDLYFSRPIDKATDTEKTKESS